MKRIHKLTAAVALTACAAGAVEMPRLFAGNHAAPASASATATSGFSSHDVNADAVSAVYRKGAAGHPHEGGLQETSQRASAKRYGENENIGVAASVDLTRYAMPVQNQGQVDSCVTWAIDYGMLGWYARRDGHAGYPFAPMYTYTQINGGQNVGTNPANALYVAKTQGTDTWADYWQGAYNWTTGPTQAERNNAAANKIQGYHYLFLGSNQGVYGQNAIVNALANGQPVAIGIQIRKGFDNMTATTPDSDTTTPSRGGHEILALGYDASGLLVQNSWGTDWGNKGFGRLAWNVVQTDISNAWVLDGSFASTTNTTTNSNTTKPVMGTVTVQTPNGYNANGIVPTRVQWPTATSANGVSRYAVYVSTNGRGWVDISSQLASKTATSLTVNLTPGSTYRFGVSAVDNNNAQSTYSYSDTITAHLYEDSVLNAQSPWTTYNWAQASGGTAITTSSAGATATLNFTGRGVSLVAPKFATAGQVYVYIDGRYVSTVDEYAATMTPHTTVFGWYWSQSGSHTISLRVAGTSGRPRVDIDAFAVLS